MDETSGPNHIHELQMCLYRERSCGLTTEYVFWFNERKKVPSSSIVPSAMYRVEMTSLVNYESISNNIKTPEIRA